MTLFIDSPFLISDTHFGHANIIKYCDRPFSTVSHMNEVLIDRWNSVVSNNDTVIHLGDFCFGAPDVYLQRLQFKTMYLIKGNHDKGRTSKEFCKDPRVTVISNKNNHKNAGDALLNNTYWLSHYEVIPCNGAKYTLHGHIHNNCSVFDTSVNLSVERIGYTPIPYEKILHYL